MPGDMFGAPIGFAHESTANYHEQLAKEAAARLPQHQAQTRFLESRANLADRQAQVQARMASELDKLSTDSDTGEKFSNPVYRIANAAMNAGDYNLAYKAGNAASQVDYREQATRTQKERGTLIQRRGQLANLELAGREMAGVKDEASFTEALTRYEAQSGQKTGLLNEEGKLTQPYSKELVDGIRGRALSAHDQLRLGIQKEENEGRERERKSKQSARSFWQNFDNIERRATSLAKARQAKTGGDSLVPLERVTRAGADFVKTQFPNILDEEARVKGRKLMQSAEALKKQNPALSTDDAMMQVLEKMKKDGEFSGQKPKVLPPGPDNAQQLPASGQASDLKDGQYYSDGKSSRQWKDGKWGPPITKTGSGKAAPSPQATLEKLSQSDEDDEDDTEAEKLALADEED